MATIYDWVAVPNASASTETVNGELTRTNLILRPEPTGTGSAGWTATSTVVWPSAFAPGEGREGRNAVKTVRDVSTPTDSIGQVHAIGAVGGAIPYMPPVTAEEDYLLSVYVKASVPAWDCQLGAYMYDASDAQVGSIMLGARTAAAPDDDGWARFSHTFAVPANAVRASFRATVSLPTGVTVGGEEVWYCDAMGESAAVVSDWFDGDTPDILRNYTVESTDNLERSYLLATVVGASANMSLGDLRALSGHLYTPRSFYIDGLGLASNAPLSRDDARRAFYLQELT